MIRMVYKLYITLVIPVRIPFEERPHWFWVTCDMIVNFLIIVDMVIKMFLTAYEDDEGNYITSRWLIIKRYLLRGFIFDFLSMLPLTFIRYVNTGGSWDDVKNTY